ncbi:Single-stranded DNA-binding replication protein A (RPA), large (70 kD) subunit [Candidatus Nanobsidianus stetteri]|uniref:Single-stranded DNA-binding replication protein A (RPA), large (70 kD) subunit n=1 Tax=Nanobsidianus stetteri TaxID=1294122 RepID=R1E4Z0_NANST|nr:Single-stranded DNA-binding replication protein A (RPA), large (70 kD) subunit [Candidatus Nanobsidianus stetteri]
MIDKNYVSSILGISKTKLQELINEKIKQYKNLIDEETAILLILKERGLTLEDLYNIKVKNLYPGLKVKEIKLKINKILIKKDNLIILEAGDETGLIKLIIKDYKWKRKKNLLKENNNIKVKNGVVLNDFVLSIFINDVDLIEKINEEIDLNQNYISYRYIRLLKEKEDNYIVLTDNFNVLYLEKTIQLEYNKTYTIKFYNKRPIEIIELKSY